MKRQKSKKYPGVYWRNTKNGDKVFDICYRVNGRLYWEKIGKVSEGYTAHHAYRIRMERIRQARHPEFTSKPAPTLSEVFEAYHKNKNLAPGTIQSQNAMWKRLRLLDAPLDKIRPFAINKLVTQWRAEKLNERYINGILLFLRTLFKYAQTHFDYTGPIPQNTVHCNKKEGERIRFLSKEEAENLLKACKLLRDDDGWLHDICMMALHTGMRKNELLNLKWHQVDFENGIITILDQKNKETGHVYMSPAVKEMLLERKTKTKSEYVFGHYNTGKKMNYISGYNTVISFLGLNKGIVDPRERVVFHTLRHTYASWLAISGTPIYTIKELMRHKTLEVTLRYAHLIPDHKREIIEKVFQK